ncbi:long-chain-acyl-CoA synthetase [Gammaproteobacteria bacterium 45_16_T64]|nr:long-chain-acyl-CoA synthetase [Gammaproteobacteria bacterium 45_16_T64]
MPQSNAVDFRSIGKQAPKLLRPLWGLKNTLKFTSKVRGKGNLNYAFAVEHAANLYPNNVLIKYENQTITYREFNERANQVSHCLISRGVKSGDVVALFLENRPEFLINMAAIAKAGAVAALINNSQTGKVLAHSLNLVSAKTVIVGEELVAALKDVEGDVESLTDILMDPDDDTPWKTEHRDIGYKNLDKLRAEFPTTNPSQTTEITPDAPCLYVYTSGTTGLPKASIQKHKKIMGIYFGLGMLMGRVETSDTIYSSLPLYHATALYLCWLPALANGGSIAIRKKFSVSEFWSDIRKYDATAFGYVGELCRYLMNQPPGELDKQHNVKMVTGNGLRPDLWKEFKNRFGIDDVREFYGSSEGNIVCYNLLNQDQTVGMTIGSYATVQFDNETEEPIMDGEGFLKKTKRGQAGLLLGRITKVTPFEGYTDPSKNQGKIFKDVFKKGDAWFNTGDLVKDIGFRHLQFVDRTGDTYRWKGENVSTTEVEMIVNQHESIAEAIAYGVEIPNTNGRAGMVAITLQPDVTELDLQSLYDHLKSELPGYAVPLFIRILSKVDSTGTFKYQRTTLKKESYEIDGVYAALPGNKHYVTVDESVVKGIAEGKYRY